MEFRTVILGTKEHKIDEYGNVYKRRSKVPPHTRKAFPDRDGYLKMTVVTGGKTYNYQIHRLVYTAFIGEVPEGMTIDHIDGNRQNNHYSNFQLLTAEENAVKGNARTWEFVSPAGEVVEIYNLAKFCRENGLHKSHMSAVYHSHPKYKQHKGWTKYEHSKSTEH